MKSANNNKALTITYDQISTRFDQDHEALWTYMQQENRVPCANSDLMRDLYDHHNEITNTGGYIQIQDEKHKIRYSVLASKTPGYFQMGGDLILMADAARNKDRTKLTTYANNSLEVIAQRIFSFNLPSLITISLVQGQTLGAGIEAAMTSDIFIAERQSTFSFPEIIFNMFPGMGAHSLLSRKVGLSVANRMIIDAKQYTAEEFHEMGIVDILAEEGKGVQAVNDFIEKHKNSSAGLLSNQKAKKLINPITRKELFSIVELWVENALILSDRDLKMMDRFIRSQQKLFNPTPATPISIHAKQKESNSFATENVYQIAG
jgi:DSF synthase